jgi:acetyl esterase/lipase
MFQDYAALLAACGVITIVFDHRLHGPTEYFTARGDVVALLEHVRTHAESYDVDPDRLVLWAFAGSGPLLTVALNPRQPCICGLIAYYCMLDFATPANVGAQAPREILETLSPAKQLRRHGCEMPVLVVRAGRDDPAVNRTVETFMEAALSSEVPVELLNHPAGALSFDVRNDDARSREIIARTLEFIRARTL